MPEMPMSLCHKEPKSSREEDDRSICRELMTVESRLMWGKQSDVKRSHSVHGPLLISCGGSGNGAAKLWGRDEGVRRK
jgi:hypothetical protein